MKIEENWADVFIYIIEFKPLSNFRELKKNYPHNCNRRGTTD